MPPKPQEAKTASQYYNIDFSLNTQLRLAGAQPIPSSGQTPCEFVQWFELNIYIGMEVESQH